MDRKRKKSTPKRTFKSIKIPQKSHDVVAEFCGRHRLSIAVAYDVIVTQFSKLSIEEQQAAIVGDHAA